MTDRTTTAGRRDFLRTGFTAAAAVGGAALLPGTPMNPAAARADGPSDNALPDLYPGWNAKQFQKILVHETAHVPAVIDVIKSLGGTPRPEPTFKGLLQPNVRAFGTVSRSLENTGTGAYRGATPVVFSRQVLDAAASIALIEARHSGFLNTLFNGIHTDNVFGDEQTFEGALSQKQINDLASPFIDSLNGGPPMSFSATPSKNNDIAILNFALTLEYLELRFYQLNVPKFYPVVV